MSAELLENVLLVLAGGVVGLGSSLVATLLQWRHEAKVRKEQWEREDRIRHNEAFEEAFERRSEREHGRAQG